jgi:Zn-dependent peptidase ImmA (M78 family)
MTRYISEEEIEEVALDLRKKLKILDVFAPDLIELLEFKLKNILPKFRLIIVPDHALRNAEAEADCSENTIKVRQSVYEDASRMGARARTTLAHEIGHLVLKHEGIRPRSVTAAVTAEEVQARYFAASFLMPLYLAKKFRSAAKIEGAFQVSKETAERRLREIAKHNRLAQKKQREWIEKAIERQSPFADTALSLLDRAIRAPGFERSPSRSVSRHWIARSRRSNERSTPIRPLN